MIGCEVQVKKDFSARSCPHTVYETVRINRIIPEFKTPENPDGAA
jgi:hypothetical protein